MCFFGKQKDVPKSIPAPAKSPEVPEVGAARKAEDDALFGGVPDLRVDRSATGGGVATGSGLSIK